MIDGIYGASFFLRKLLDNKSCIDLQNHPPSAEDETPGCDLTSEIQLSYSARLKAKIEYIKDYMLANDLADHRGHTVSLNQYGPDIHTDQAASPDEEATAGAGSGSSTISSNQLPAGNGDEGVSIFIKKIAGFAEHMNELLSLLGETDDSMEKNDRAAQEATKSVRMPEKHTIPSKAVFTEMAGNLEEQAMPSGIKISNEGLLSVDEETLSRFLSSKGDEGISIVKSFTNVFYDRMLMCPGAGPQALPVVSDYNNRHTVNNTDGRINARLEEKRQELEKKMNVLQMLIESSKVLKEEFAKQLFVV